MVRLEDPLSKITRLFPPGGMIEEKEEPWEAARREAVEETGHEVEVIRESEKLYRYDFVWAGRSFDCSTYFYSARLIRLVSTDIDDAVFHRGAEWIPKSEIASALDFHDIIQRAVLEKL